MLGKEKGDNSKSKTVITFVLDIFKVSPEYNLKVSLELTTKYTRRFLPLIKGKI